MRDLGEGRRPLTSQDEPEAVPLLVQKHLDGFGQDPRRVLDWRGGGRERRLNGSDFNCLTSLSPARKQPTKGRQLVLHLQHHPLPDVLQQADDLVVAQLRQVDAVHRLDVVSHIQLIAPVGRRKQAAWRGRLTYGRRLAYGCGCAGAQWGEMTVTYDDVLGRNLTDVVWVHPITPGCSSSGGERNVSVGQRVVWLGLIIT